MLLIVLLFVCYGQLESFHLNSQGGNRFLGTSRAELKRTLLKASQFDENLTDLDQLGRAELQTLAKEYGIKATGKTAEIIEQLSLAISSINAESEGELPSAEQTLKVSPLEKTVTVETSTGTLSAKYGISNSNLDIQEVLRDQGVRIDDLMALRDSLMKGGFKFNEEEDEGDFADSEEQLSDEDIDREFYGSDNEFGATSDPFNEGPKRKSGKETMGSSKTAFDAMQQEEEKSAANKLKSKAIKEAKALLKLEGKTVKKIGKVEIKLKPQSTETTGYSSSYVKKAVVSSSNYDKIQQQVNQSKKEYESELLRGSILDSFYSKKASDNNDIKSVKTTGNDEDEEDEDEEEEEEEEEKEEWDVKEIPTLKTPSKVMPKVIPRLIPNVIVKKDDQPVYQKLKRRQEEEYEEEEDVRKEDNFGDFDSLEALENRMDDLYGELDSAPKIPDLETKIPEPGPKIPTAEFNDGSDSKNPIKWRNGRLVSDKDRFHDVIRKESERAERVERGEGREGDESGEGGEGVEGDDSEEGEEGEGEEKEGVSAEDEKDQDKLNQEKNLKKMKKSSNKKVVVELTGVTMKNMLEHLETTIGFEGLYEETNLRCFDEKPSINSSLKVLRQLPLEWARKKIEYLYIQSKKRL